MKTIPNDKNMLECIWVEEIPCNEEEMYLIVKIRYSLSSHMKST